MRRHKGESRLVQVQGDALVGQPVIGNIAQAEVTNKTLPDPGRVQGCTGQRLIP